MQTEVKLVHEDVSELGTNTANALDHISVCMDSTENTIPPAIVMDKVVQLRSIVIVLIEGRSDQSNEMDLRFSRVAEPLALSKSKNDAGFIAAPIREERRELDKELFTQQISILLSQKAYRRQTLKKSPGSVLKPHNTSGTYQHF